MKERIPGKDGPHYCLGLSAKGLFSTSQVFVASCDVDLFVGNWPETNTLSLRASNSNVEICNLTQSLYNSGLLIILRLDPFFFIS